MWQAWKLSRTYRCRPSELLGVESGTIEALYLDRAVFAFGQRVDSAIEEAMKDKKGSQAEAAGRGALNRWLGIKDDKAFRAPTATR